MNLKCTKKLLDKLKIKQFDNIEVSENIQDIENWHCNVIDFGKIYAVLLTNDKTLFSFYLFGFKTNDFKNFNEIIQQNIFKIMLNLGFEQKQFELILESLENIKFTKTDNKSLLASMNQMMPYIYHSMDKEKDLLEINKGLNDLPNNKLGWKTPREEFELLLSSY